jgi:hypothetical protein
MRNILLLLIAVLGLYSFSGSREERDAYIKQAIEQRVKEAKMEIKDIRIVQVEDISERTYTNCIVKDGVFMVSENVQHTITLAKADPDGERKWQEKLAKLSNEKGYGYFVKIKCHLDGDGRTPGKRTMQFVVSQAGTDLAMRRD